MKADVVCYIVGSDADPSASGTTSRPKPAVDSLVIVREGQEDKEMMAAFVLTQIGMHDCNRDK